jgi:hypothetical protein
MKTVKLSFLYFLLCFHPELIAQVALGTATPAASSILDVTSTSKGLLFPRMTNAQVSSVVSPASGLMIYCTDCNSGTGCYVYYNGTLWIEMVNCSQPSSIIGNATPNQNTSGLNYSVTNVSGISYTWMVPLDWVITSGQGTSSITVTSGTTDGIISVLPSNSFGPGPGRTLSVTLTGIQLATCGSTRNYLLVSAAGYTWFDRNLGASQVAVSSTDYFSYGSLYQWGRQSDGHQCITWTGTATGTPVNGVTATQCTGGTCANSLFVTRNLSPYDWNSADLNSLWNGSTKGSNDPCPAGYRVPSLDELTALNNSFSPQTSSGAYNSPVKLVLSGMRNYDTGSLSSATTIGAYWTSTFNGTYSASYLNIAPGGNTVTTNYRADGFSVRCIAQ